MASNILSKSSFIRGLQCHKSLYLYKNHYKLQDPLSDEQKEKFRNGHDFGFLAQKLFPGGVNTMPRNVYAFDKSIIDTRNFIEQGKKIIYEAAFIYDEVLAALDILVNEDSEWTAYEVKNSFEISETYLLDAALQYYLITNSGLKLDNFCIIYRKEIFEELDNFDIKDIFITESVLDIIIEKQVFIADQIAELKKATTDKETLNIKMGEHCNNPYPCSFIGYCTRQGSLL